MASVDSTQRKRNNYKILVDPELKQGHKKVYRLNGKDVTGFPPVGEPKDPRTQKTVLGVTGSTVDLKVPRFKYDKFWNGEPPDRDVFVIGLNESVKGSLLKEVCTEIASVHSIKFHRHPKTKTFLGAATVSFMRSGEGRRAAGELDGRIVGGCYLRAELDDRGEHLQKYLEPVLKKCNFEKKPKLGMDGSECKDSGVASSDVEESRTRHSSVAESGQELSESETEQHPGATPITPTRRKSSDSFLAPSKSTKLYPFSSLMLSSCTPSTFSESSPTPTIFSPGFTNYTPSSIDSGISLRTNTILSPQEATKTKLPRTFQSPLPPPTSNTPPPPLPPEEKAPPLPPQDQEAPPPLPPLPPASKQDSSGQDGIENISSEEEEEDGNREVGAKKGEVFDSKIHSEVDTISPVSLSPPNSPKTTAGSTNMNVQPANFSSQVNSHFDPSLGLQTLLANRNATASGTPMDVSTSPYIAVSPGPTTASAVNVSSYELEVEEISGDESPVMVYDASFEPLKVESVSDDEVDMGGDDMEVCSDDENAQDTVIEVNVRPVVQQQAFPPMMGGVPPHLPPPLPPHLAQLPHSFFPHRPPPPFPPPPPHPPPPHGPDFVPPHPPLPPPHTHHPSDMNPPLPDMLPSQFDTLPAPYLKDFPSPRLPNGYMSYSNSSRFTSNRNKSDRTLHLPKSKKESISQDVLCKALNQLRAILLNDVQKKLVESYAYSALDSFWEKREKEKLMQKSSTEQTSEGGEKVPKPVVEPYRRMLPGLKVRPDGETGVSEEEEEGEPSLPTPRKRLMNFKIPLINRGAQRRDQSLSSIVARRRLFSDEEDIRNESVAPSRGSRSYYSDISSEELSSPSESEEEFSGEEEEESEMESAFEESENSEEDADKEYRDIFGSSEESAGEERETEVKPPSRRTSTRSDISGDEQTATKQKRAKPSGHRTSSGGEEDILRTSALGSEVLKKTEHLVVEEKEKLSQIQLDKIIKPKPAPPRPQFKKRLVSGDEEILRKVMERGPDKEDVQMFRLALGRMKSDGDEMVMGVSWAYYPHISLSAPPPKRRRLMLGRRGWEEEEGEHMTGCARSEGYYKIDMRKKKKYLPHHRMMKHPTTSVPGKKTASSGRVNRANQRRLASVFSSGDISSDLAKYNQLKARKKQLRFAKSTIHNWGLFAMENIAADEMVIEYVGEMVRQAVADERERRYEAAGIGSSYLFRVDHDYIIDATRNGNLARFINHCCDPNCYAKVISFGTQKKIVIYSKRDIALGEEITYDYKFPIEEDKIPCLCGAPNCRGTLN